MPSVGRLTGSLSAAVAGTIGLVGVAVAGDCAVLAKQAERDYDIPSGLVQAIAQVESGHNPWAVAVGTKMMVKDDKDHAMRVVRTRPAKGIYVGCMQLSVKHHEWAFDNKLDMLDPARNVDYGAQLLVELQEATGNWSKAVQRYQGGSPEQRQRYACKIAVKLRGIDPKSPALAELPRCGDKAPAKPAAASVSPVEDVPLPAF
jgi:soluble lytic murein transglycosylase-like protein